MRTQYTPRPPYPPDWVDIAEAARLRAAHCCVECGAQGLLPEEYDDWDAPGNLERIIEVHHVDGNPANCADENLRPLCRLCHRDIHRRMREKRKHADARAAGQVALTI